MKQAQGEPEDDFVTRLRGHPKFGKIICKSSSSFEDKIILGSILRDTSNANFHRSVFEKGLSSLEKVIQLESSMETSSFSLTSDSGFGIIYQHYMTKDQTINSDYYVDVFQAFLKRLRKERPRKGCQWMASASRQCSPSCL
ncbi:unnamed protein product [Lepeophtheirus salmonis]|uniref:(salmon louse) hypothetical protein n=1 Tax=Lepeophtheirus salmonis TaxID=72036 RepID=A0A7R8D1A3_LEPSM|nr:unnamed protein product [Lepeophtheirus salmonis]CAF2991513.1 unnamed protein product [Lepeophtheirus salmonis]